MMQAEGMTAKVSSIHVNGWFGRYDKLGMTRRFLRRSVRRSTSTREKSRFVFAGDSPNDAPMFAYFPLSVGVANVRRVRSTGSRRCRRTSSEAEAGAGFVELAESIAAAKKRIPRPSE